MTMESRGVRPILDYLSDIKAVASNYNASLTLCTSGFEEWINQVFENALSESPQGLVGMGPHPRPEWPSLEIAYVNYAGPDVQSDSAASLGERALSLNLAATSSPLPAERLDDCESPSKKARTDVDCSSPMVPFWARDPAALDGGSRGGPIASPCRSGPVGRCLGPMPKDPPPRDLRPQAPAEEPEPRELSSPKKRLREAGESPSPLVAAGFGKVGDLPGWQINHPLLFGGAQAQVKSAPVLAKGSQLVPRLPDSLARPAVASTVGQQATEPSSTGRDSLQAEAKRIQAGIETPQSSSGPSVKDRMRLFESSRPSPASWKKTGSVSAPVGSPATAVSGIAVTNPAVANASQLSMPAIKPKALFSLPDASQRSHSGQHSGRGPQPQPEGGSSLFRTPSLQKLQEPSKLRQPQQLSHSSSLSRVGSNSSLSGAPKLKHSGSNSSFQSVMPTTGQQQQPQRPQSLQEPKLKHTASNSSLRDGGLEPKLKHTASNSSLRDGGVPISVPPQQKATSSLGNMMPLKPMGSMGQQKHTASSSSLGSCSVAAPAPTQLKHACSTSSLGSAGATTAQTAQRKHTASSTSLCSSALTASAPSLPRGDSAPGIYAACDTSAPTSFTEPGCAVEGSSTADACSGSSSGGPTSKKKAHRRSACLEAEEPEPFAQAAAPPAAKPDEVAHQESILLQVQPEDAALGAPSSSTAANADSAVRASEGLGGAVSSSGTVASSAFGNQRPVRPPVPVFTPEPQPAQLDPCMAIRQMQLSEKLAEDNYEISEQGDASDGEDGGAKDRSHKHVPKWCGSFLEELKRQCDIDPDTIWGDKVAQCNLEEIFPNELYRQAGKGRPKRARGSSGDWRKDRLRKDEISAYKTRMGHIRPWTFDEAKAGA